MTTVDPLLVAQIDVAMWRPSCEDPSCGQPAAWTLIAPCGHTTVWCDLCHHETTEAVHRFIHRGEEYVCPRDGYEGSWSQFRWETT